MTLLTPEWSRDLRRRASGPSFSAAREALDQRLAEYHRFLPQVPTHQAGYYHDFFCPEHAVQFIYDPREPHRHVCPVCGAVYSGEPYDSAWRWSVNDMLSDAALKLAFRSHLTGGQGEQAQADRDLSSRILFTYAERYRHMEPPPLDHPNHPGIVAWSGLDESVWLIRMCWAFALLENTLPKGSAGRLARQMFRPGAEHILRVRWPEIHNATNWNNAALATLALVLEDEELLEVALGGDLGLEPQLTQGVSQDGIWWEGSLSYHYYMLDAVVWTLRILRASGRSFDDGGILKRMFLAPILISFPDLKLPAVNDCWYFIGLQQRVGHGIPEADGFYETAYGWTRDPAFAWVLHQNYEKRPRTCFEALLDGAREIPPGEEPELKSLHMEDLGFVVLRGGDRRNGSHLIFKAGPDGGVHGHHDQLRIQLFANGAPGCRIWEPPDTASNSTTPGTSRRPATPPVSWTAGPNRWPRERSTVMKLAVDIRSAMPLSPGRRNPTPESRCAESSSGATTTSWTCSRSSVPRFETWTGSARCAGSGPGSPWRCPRPLP